MQAAYQSYPPATDGGITEQTIASAGSAASAAAAAPVGGSGGASGLAPGPRLAVPWESVPGSDAIEAKRRQQVSVCPCMLVS